MSENKTQPTRVSPESYLAAIEDAGRREDCTALAHLMARATGHPAVMWGTGIVGFGSYHYRYDSGREGDSCLTGFASRKGDISVYLMADFPQRDELLAQLGKHKLGKACLYIRKLGDIDARVLEQLVLGSVAQLQRTYG
jgi:hypothetical protein